MPWIRAAATAARSSESLNAVGLVSRYGSNSSAYSSHASSRSARPTLSASRSGSAPTSGSALPGGITSLLAPSCAPASITCATSSSSSGTISSLPSPRPSAARASRKSRACAAIRSASARHGSDIERPPSLERPSQRHLVGILQVASDGQPAGRPGDPQAERLHQPGQVRRGGLALEIRVGGQDQLADPQVLGSDAVHRADRAAEHVIPAAELADLLDRRHVLRLLYHADHRRVPAHVQADPALVILGDVAAGAAELHLLGYLDQGRSEAAHILRADRQQVKRDPLRALRADTGKLAKLVDQVLDDSLVHLSVRPLRVRPLRARPNRPRRPAAATPAAYPAAAYRAAAAARAAPA